MLGDTIGGGPEKDRRATEPCDGLERLEKAEVKKK